MTERRSTERRTGDRRTGDRRSGPARTDGRRRRRWMRGAAGLAVLLGGLALGGYLYERHRTGSIYHPHARFVAQPTPKLPSAGPERFAWPNYGYTADHTRFYPAPERVRPPFRRVWTSGTNSLLEFPPVIYGERIFQMADDAVLRAIDKHNGHVLWRRSLGRLSASTPAVTSSTLYATILDAGGPGSQGRVVALDSATGAVRWSRLLPSRSESSPLVAAGRVFFGSEDGTVYALDARTGATVWTYRAPGAVKASPSLSEGRLYFGDYSGHVQAISAASGRRVWISSSEGALLGSGTFYSTAAVLYGRVYLGNTDGRVYAYDAADGALDWAVQTGAYVYASPAVTNAPGIGPTVYVGSYDGDFYAINARSGAISWRFHAHGRISGSATVIGRIVYFADLASHHIYGLGISTGRVAFQLGTGAFDPAVSDGHNLYLTGYSGLYCFEPSGGASARGADPAVHELLAFTAAPSEKRALMSKLPGE